MEATRKAQDKTNSKLSASTSIIYYYTTNMTKMSLDPNCRPPLAKTSDHYRLYDTTLNSRLYIATKAADSVD